MATDKLGEGIKGFSKAIETLEQQLAHRLAEVEGGSAFSHAVQEIFLLNDFNGDGWVNVMDLLQIIANWGQCE